MNGFRVDDDYHVNKDNILSDIEDIARFRHLRSNILTKKSYTKFC